MRIGSVAPIHPLWSPELTVPHGQGSSQSVLSEDSGKLAGGPSDGNSSDVSQKEKTSATAARIGMRSSELVLKKVAGSITASSSDVGSSESKATSSSSDGRESMESERAGA